VAKEHVYAIAVRWTGNQGSGTSAHRAYSREHVIEAIEKHSIEGSSDPAFLGDPSRYSPEDLLVASVSACHMLWYLHLCAGAGIIVVAYTDHAVGTMEEDAGGSGRITGVTLRPEVMVEAGADLARARSLHDEASRMCFIANSVSFPIVLDPDIKVEPVVTL
jgi:organic hydroperoxide reductase OsmC/OhrA